MRKITLFQTLILLSIICIISNTGTHSATAAPAFIKEKQLAEEPKVIVFKSVQQEEYYLGDDIIVTVEIKNVGETPMYSV